MIYAHSVEGRPETEWETLEEHALRVAAAAAERAAPFGGEDLARALGLLHDLGKVKDGFQARIRGARERVSHSAEGAKALTKWHGFADPFGVTITGHHGRLPNPEHHKDRLETAKNVQLPDWCTLPEFELPFPPDKTFTAFRLQFLTRMLYGALCDADDRETAAFYSENQGKPIASRPQEVSQDMRVGFDTYMDSIAGTGPVNALRRYVLEQARKQASRRPGHFTLTVPTGGGKTLTSLGFALDHALTHGLRRIVYVIPYTSIVEQTADVFTRALGPDLVLEHQSSVDWDGDDETEAEQHRVAASSWDVPVIVTTAVQFFESLYAARKKRCRKLPSIAKSVIILDEAQTTPLPFLRPCLAALNELVDGYGSSVVLCTATQPSLTKEGGFPAAEAIENATEIAPDPPALFAALKRVQVNDIGPQGDAQLAEKLRQLRQVLTIVDNRQQARGLFEEIRTSEGAAHLSTLMVPAHRRAVLSGIRSRLSSKLPVRLVSTSLIEAGVDVDFPYVLRASSGIDSIAQAAGRCNREGKLDYGTLDVFRSEHSAPDAVEQFARIGRAVLARFSDPISQDAVAEYFRCLWSEYGVEALDTAEVAGIRGVLAAIKKGGKDCRYEDIERAFQIIAESQRNVIIRDGDWGIASPNLERARHLSPGGVAQLVRAHTVSVPWSMWKSLWASGLVSWWEADIFDEQFAMIDSSDAYDPQAGLSASVETGGVI